MLASLDSGKGVRERRETGQVHLSAEGDRLRGRLLVDPRFQRGMTHEALGGMTPVEREAQEAEGFRNPLFA
jgi:hypothetical protein